jgi:hypothetical protein
MIKINTKKNYYQLQITKSDSNKKRLSQKYFNTEIRRNRVTQSIVLQFYFLCETHSLCYSVFKFFTFETASCFLK